MHPFEYQSVDNVTLTANFWRIQKIGGSTHSQLFYRFKREKMVQFHSVKRKLILYVQDKNEVCEQ